MGESIRLVELTKGIILDDQASIVQAGMQTRFIMSESYNQRCLADLYATAVQYSLADLYR